MLIITTKLTKNNNHNHNLKQQIIISTFNFGKFKQLTISKIQNCTKTQTCHNSNLQNWQVLNVKL